MLYLTGIDHDVFGWGPSKDMNVIESMMPKRRHGFSEDIMLYLTVI